VRSGATVLIFFTCVYRCVTVSANVTVMRASVLLIVYSLDAEAVTIATQLLPIVRYVSVT